MCLCQIVEPRIDRHKLLNLIMERTSLAYLFLFIGVCQGTKWQASDFPQVTSVGMVAATGDGDCSTAYTDNSRGPGVGFSKDFGATWTFELAGSLNTGIGVSESGNGVMSSIGKIYFREGFNGTWNVMEGRDISFSQSVSCFGDESFAVAGAHYPGGVTSDVVNGVAVTHNTGAEWEYVDIGLPYDTYPARYSSFPSDDVWYVSAGSWKNTPGKKTFSMDESEYAMNEMIIYKNGNFTFQPAIVSDDLHFGAIAKSNDGGKTWEQVYNTLEYYFNAISCISEDICMAVAEQPYEAVALRTEDGGKTWNNVLTISDNKMASLMGCQMLSENEVWVSGGTFDSGLQGWFYHSTDGGESWDKMTAAGASFGVSFANGVGYSPAIFEVGASVNVYN